MKWENIGYSKEWESQSIKLKCMMLKGILIKRKL